MFRTGEAGINLIKNFESLALQSYLCPAGKLSIGYGHTEGVAPGEQITPQQADELLRQDLSRSERFINRLVTVPLNQNQFDALISFCFNVGSGNLQNSTLLRLLNEGKYNAAAEQFLAWNRMRGQVLEGLTRRREAERNLFLQPVDQPVSA